MSLQTPNLVKVTWTDAHNNQGSWVYGPTGVEEFAKDVRFRVAQVGYVVWHDEECVVIASRISNPSEDEHRAYGQLERIPLPMIESMENIDA